MQLLKDFIQNTKRWWSSRKSVTKHWIISGILTLLVVGLSIVITQSLILQDVEDRLAPTGSTNQQISLIANFLDVDATARTVTVDWYPLPFHCSSAEMVVNIFVDPNLLVASGSGDDPETASADPPSVPVFQLNTTTICHPNNHNSFAVFRTTSKLTGKDTSGRSSLKSHSLQAYPFDVYFFQISMFASLASTNETVGIFLGKSFGIPINFDVTLNKAGSSNNEEGILLSFTVARSAAVIGLVVLIMGANWLVTIAFLWITVAAFIWEAEIVTEMFVLPIGALFAFTSVRANLPGAPTGFGAVVDYYGILPNLALITLFSAVLLLGVLYRRVRSASKSRKVKQADEEDQPMTLEETVVELKLALKAAVAGMEKVVAAMDLRPPATGKPDDGNSASGSDTVGDTVAGTTGADGEAR